MGQYFSKLSLLSEMAPINLVQDQPPLDHLPSASSSKEEDEQQYPDQRPPGEIEEEQELEEQVVRNSTTEEEEEEEEEEENITNIPSQSNRAPKPRCGSIKRLLWSEGDEITILKGMIEYHFQKGADPHFDISEFHEFIKNSLCNDASKSKFVDKVRKLKEKFNKNVKKGKRVVFCKPHDLECFELSKKIWGGGSQKKRKGVDRNGLRRSKRARKMVELDVNNEPATCSWAMNPCLKQLTLPFDDLSLSEPTKSFIMQNTRMIGRAEAEELEKQWKDLLVDEVGVYLKRVELVKKRTELMLDAIKASND